jgi:putative FmdB family regulatory protein
MPTYEYECQECGIHFDEFQRMSDPPIRKCPKCGGRVKRIISGGAGLIFKGSGFYATDYKKPVLTSTSEKKNQKKSEKKTPSEEKSAAKNADSSEPKPASKTENETTKPATEK